MHGDDDQIVPYADAGPLSAELAQNGSADDVQGIPVPPRDTINADLLAFVRS